MYKYSYEEIKKEFEEKGYILLSKEFKGVLEKLEYICPKHKDKGSQFITFSKLHSCNRGCKYCGHERTAKKRRIDFDKKYDKNLCIKHGFEYIDTIRKDGKIMIMFICNKHRELGIQYMVKPNMQRDIKGCKYCSGKQLPEWYVLDKLKKVSPHIELLEPYVNLTTSIKYYCKKHNQYSKNTLQNLLKGEGCCYCGREKLSVLNMLSKEEYQQRVSLKNPNVTVLEYNGSHSSVAKFKCNLCSHIWESSASYMSSDGKLCPNCQKMHYKGEKRVSDVLNVYNIEYIEQYRFEDCKDKRPLPFDFFLPKYNICIEYDGKQHFEQREGWTDLKHIQYHDNIKTRYCEENNIKLIRIPYWDFNNIESIIKEYI